MATTSNGWLSGFVDTYLSLEDLSLKTRVSQRSIRNYIERGVLDRPVHWGRHALYSQSHLTRLLDIKSKLKRGVRLADLASDSPTAGDRVSPISSLPVDDKMVRLIQVVPGICIQADAHLDPQQKRVLNALRSAASVALQEILTKRPKRPPSK